MSPTPIILIGRHPKILEKVREDLMPEYDGDRAHVDTPIHTLRDVDRAVKDLPLLFSNPTKIPENSATNSGSQNYGERPRAVAVGGGFDDAAFKVIKDACKNVDKDVVWMRADTSLSQTMPSFSDTDAFGAVIAQRSKAKLNELGVGSGTASNTGEVYYF